MSDFKLEAAIEAIAEQLGRMMSDTSVSSSETPNSSGNHFPDSMKKIDGDTIYRQAAIDAFDCSVGGVPVESVKYVSEYADKMKSRINTLPSAQPERENEPVGCNGCRYDWFGDPRCAKCARSFQDHYEADMRGEQDD